MGSASIQKKSQTWLAAPINLGTQAYLSNLMQCVYMVDRASGQEACSSLKQWK